MLNDEQIDAIAEGQTDCTYEDNGIFIVKQQMKYAIKQALELDSGKQITLPKGKIMHLNQEVKAKS